MSDFHANFAVNVAGLILYVPLNVPCTFLLPGTAVIVKLYVPTLTAVSSYVRIKSPFLVIGSYSFNDVVPIFTPVIYTLPLLSLAVAISGACAKPV